MARLGSNKKPAVVHVRTLERAQEIVTLCDDRGWKVMVGIEPEKPEDLGDLERLLAGDDVDVRPVVHKPKTERNAPCPCGSGRKYKKCCGRA